jgi:hypothetical protein
MMQKISVSITSEKIAKWEQEAKELEAKIRVDQEKLQLLRRRIEMVPLYLDETVALKDEAQLSPVSGDATGVRSMKPPSVIEFLVNRAAHPITIAELKKQIEATGYDVARFGKGFRYLYSLMPRLVEAGRISRVHDKLGPKRTPVLPGMETGGSNA